MPLPEGRPTKRTDANKAIVLEAVRHGTSRTGAAKLIGIHYETLRAWIASDSEFALAVTRAEGDMERTMVALIREQAVMDWRAAAWYLERRITELYGQRAKVDLTFDVKAAALQVAAEAGLAEEATVESRFAAKGYVLAPGVAVEAVVRAARETHTKLSELAQPFPKFIN